MEVLWKKNTYVILVVGFRYFKDGSKHPLAIETLSKFIAGFMDH